MGFYNTMFPAMGIIECAIDTMIMREMAMLSEVEGGAQLQRDLLRTTEILYIICTSAGSMAVTLAAPTIVRTWLHRSTPGEDTLIQCVVLMGWTVTLQLFASL